MSFEVSLYEEGEEFVVAYGYISKRHIRCPTNDLAKNFQSALHSAYRHGKADMRDEFRNLLGIKEED